MENINLIIGNNIKELRKANKLTQFELAEKLNYSNKTVSRWESGEIIPDVETLNKICEIFNISISKIFEENAVTIKPEKIHKFQIGNKLTVSLLSVLLVWLIAVVVYVHTRVVFNLNLWQVFVWSVPASCIVGIVFNSLWGNKMFNYTIISVLNWSILASLYLTLLEYNLWLIFLIGIPVQIGIILWSNITRNNIIKKKNLNKKTEQ